MKVSDGNTTSSNTKLVKKLSQTSLVKKKKKKSKETTETSHYQIFCNAICCSLLESGGQFSSTTVWVGVSYLQKPFSSFLGGYPLLMLTEGLASATFAVPFTYCAYRVGGDTADIVKKKVKLDFASSLVLDSSFQFFSDLVVYLDKRDSFTFWAEPSYENTELAISVGIFFTAGFLNFSMLEWIARREGTTREATLNRVKESAMVWLLYTWFFCMDRWTDSYYHTSSDVATKVEDSVLTGMGVAIPALVFDLLINLGILLKNKFCEDDEKNKKTTPTAKKTIALTPVKTLVRYNSTDDLQAEEEESDDEDVIEEKPGCGEKVKLFFQGFGFFTKKQEEKPSSVVQSKTNLAYQQTL